ncbi:MAG TPA: YMGG-like glycine zipper-containing protein [Blastocatellia bacterium]|nr:YMGG-like glycine zipper-containing protein [Blastocatellia bacterium]
MNRRSVRNWVCLLVAACLVLLTFDIGGDAAQRRYRNREAGKKKAAKRIGVGAAIGAAAGGLIGGKKGAVIGAGAGAAGGGAYHVHKKRQYRRRHRR